MTIYGALRRTPLGRKSFAVNVLGLLVSLFQLNRVEVTAFIQLSAPYLVRCLMLGGTDIQDGTKSQVEIAYCFPVLSLGGSSAEAQIQ